MRKRALTLLEVVVISCALMVVMVSIAPVLAAARQRGKDVVCLQNLRRISQASIVYSGADPANHAIPVSPVEVHPTIGISSVFSELPAYAYGGKSGVGSGSSSNIVTSTFGPNFDMNSANRPLNRVLFRDSFGGVSPRPGSSGVKWYPDANLELDAYRCPSDSGFTGLHVHDGWEQSRLSSYDYFGTSYAANVFWTAFEVTNATLMSNSPYLHSLDRIVDPARTIAYLENNGRSAWRAAPDLCPSIDPADYLIGEAGGWHGKAWQFQTAFIDGHVKTTQIRGYRPDNEFDDLCGYVRGDDWQIDTRPLDPVITNHPRQGPGRTP